MQASNHKRRSAFSVSEVLAVLLILGIVTTILMPHVTTSSDLANRHAHEEYKAQINAAVERFYINEDRWPAEDLSDISRNRTYFPAGVPTNPIDGTAYTLSSTTHRVK